MAALPTAGADRSDPPPPNSANPTHGALRWLAIPAAFALFVLVGLAVSAEDRERFEARERFGEPSSDSERSGGNGTFDGDMEFDPDSDGDGDGESTLVDFEVRSDTGRVGVELTEQGVPVIPAPGGEPVTLPPDPGGQADGFRLDDSGRFEQVSPADIRPGDLVIDPDGNGVSLPQSDGGSVRLERPGGTTGGLEVTQISPDGARAPAQVNSDGEIDLGDGVILRLPTGDDAGIDTSSVDSPQPSLWEQATTTPWRWVFLAIIVLAVASAAWAYYLHRTRPEQPFGADFVGPDGIPEDRFAEFLQMLLDDPDPSRAIRLAFAAAERGMAHLPSRTDTETPGEWSRRVVDVRPDLAGPLDELCDWFSTVRFADVPPTAADRDAAVAALRELHRRAHAGHSGSTGSPPAGGDPVGADA